MNTETTEYIKGWVFYDAKCPICSAWVERSHALMVRRGFHPVPLQAPWAATKLGLTPGERLTEMKLLLANGRVFGGADALLQIARAIWWTWPIYAFAQIPGVSLGLRILYRRLAADRHCLGRVCALPAPRAEHSRHLTSSFYEFP